MDRLSAITLPHLSFPTKHEQLLENIISLKQKITDLEEDAKKLSMLTLWNNQEFENIVLNWEDLDEKLNYTTQAWEEFEKSYTTPPIMKWFLTNPNEKSSLHKRQQDTNKLYHSIKANYYLLLESYFHLIVEKVKTSFQEENFQAHHLIQTTIAKHAIPNILFTAQDKNTGKQLFQDYIDPLTEQWIQFPICIVQNQVSKYYCLNSLETLLKNSSATHSFKLKEEDEELKIKNFKLVEPLSYCNALKTLLNTNSYFFSSSSDNNSLIKIDAIALNN